MAQEIEDIAAMKLPEALKQLKTGYEAMERIARYCHGAQKKKEYQQIYMQSQNYSQDALENAAHHVNAIGIHLTQFLTLQAERVDQLDIHIKILTDRLSGLKASAGLAHYHSEKAELDAYSGARNALVPAQSLPMSSRIVARHLRKPISADMFLEKPVFNQHFVDPVPPPFATPMTVDDFVAWRDESGALRATKAPGTGAAVPAIDMPKAKKSKKEKSGAAQHSGRKTKRKKDSTATPAGDAPPPPLDAAVPPPPPGPAPPPPI
jgi:hypothetical protein